VTDYNWEINLRTIILFSEPKEANDRGADTVLTGRLTAQDTDFRQQGTENLVPRCDKWLYVLATILKISRIAVQLHANLLQVKIKSLA
jgi:hypothetical protein